MRIRQLSLKDMEFILNEYLHKASPEMRKQAIPLLENTIYKYKEIIDE